MGGLLKVSELIEGSRNGVVFVCVGNSARSQMAEGFARYLSASDIKVFSAGSNPSTVNPMAIRAMKEVGIDISSHVSKKLSTVPIDTIAVAITLCSPEECPPLPAHVQRLDWPLPDPADKNIAESDRLLAFRQSRDEIRELVSSLF